MALVKSPQSSHYEPHAREPVSEAPAPAASAAQAPRRGTDFGRKSNGPSADTYVKIRFSDTPDMPETWFKLNIRPDGVHAFEATTREHPVVLLMNKGDSKLRMYHVNDAGNFDAVGPKRFEHVLAEIQVRKRRDSTPENPQYFLVGNYFAEGNNGDRELRGNVVGAKSKELMHELSQASYQEWKASQPPRENNRAPVAPPTMELVAGQELNFGI